MLWYCISSIPHIYYMFLYHYGDKIINYVSFNTILYSCINYRVVQFPYTLFHLYSSYFHTINPIAWVSPNPFLLIGFTCLACGTFINYKVYDAIGIDRVYYSCELNNSTFIRINKFPYNYMNHPMYYACILISIGTFLSIGITSDYKIRIGVLNDMLYISYLYMFSILIEDEPSLALK